LSFESRLISQRTHAESDSAAEGLLEESPVERRQARASGPHRGLPQGPLPLSVPLTLLKHHLNRYSVPDWVHQQVYLHPYPKELMLRNHV